MQTISIETLTCNLELTESTSCLYTSSWSPIILQINQPRQLIHKNLTTKGKAVLSDHIKQAIFLDFQTGGCLLLHSAISNHNSITITVT